MANRDALRARGLGILELTNAVRGSNFLLPSGSLRAGDRDYNVFTNTQVPDVRPCVTWWCALRRLRLGRGLDWSGYRTWPRWRI